MPKFLIIVADDFGLHETVNEAVEQASSSGMLTAAGLMVVAFTATDAIRRANSLPGLRVGYIVIANGLAVLPHDAISLWADEDQYVDGEMLYKSIRALRVPGVRRQDRGKNPLAVRGVLS